MVNQWPRVAKAAGNVRAALAILSSVEIDLLDLLKAPERALLAEECVALLIQAGLCVREAQGLAQSVADYEQQEAERGAQPDRVSP